MCGVGTIPIEAAQGFDAKTNLGLDISGTALAYSISNAGEAGSDVNYHLGDATQLPFRSNSIDRVVSNLPWGRQVQGQQRLRDTYETAIAEFSRVLCEKGRVVLLTDRVGLALHAAEAVPGLHLATATQISLFGSHPTICVLVKSAQPVNPLSPFQMTGALDQDLNELACRFTVDNLRHPDYRIKIHAAHMCSLLQDPTAIPNLKGLLNDDDGRVRRAASEALKNLS
jgi:hypothetical protein